MKCLRHCVSQNFAISDSESNTEATYQASETCHHVTFDSATKGRGRDSDTKYFCLPVSPKKRVRSSSLPPIPVLKYTAVKDSIQASGEHDLVNLYHIMEADECLLSPQNRRSCISLACSELHCVCIYLTWAGSCPSAVAHGEGCLFGGAVAARRPWGFHQSTVSKLSHVFAGFRVSLRRLSRSWVVLSKLPREDSRLQSTTLRPCQLFTP